jgi:hypothetical protein
MIRSVLFTLVVVCAALWLPWWVSATLFILGIIVMKYPIALIVPAAVTDWVFAAHETGIHNFFHNHAMLCIVAALLVIRYSILAKTRVGILYS